jgi:predicted ATPase/DNA-binding CsgD family transcriptional regulator
MTKAASARSVGNLAAEVTSFVGRRQETAEVRRLLAVSRLVTLTGVGGVGKTRLALRVAGEVGREFRDGVWFVDLAPLDDEGLLTQAVASALGLQEIVVVDWPVSVIASHLKDKNLLLVLDNCEHLRDGCAVLVDALLRQAPELRVLATSRHTLGLTPEHVFPVPPMSLPEDTREVRLQVIAHYEAVNLFLARAQAVRSTFELTEDNVGAVVAVCRRLDGIPLAIELAAARLSALSVQDLLERLENRFALLSVGSSTALPRHQTLRELIGWSWDLCSAEERTLWSRMSVFPSDFDLQAAESICAGGDLDSHSVLDLLTALVEKTVVTLHEENGRSRYRMLDTLRQYGQEQSAAADEQLSVRDKHRAYYLQLVGAAREDSFSARQRNWLARLRPEYSNIRAALDTSFDHPELVEAGLDTVSDLWLFWIATGRTSEARRWLDRGLRSSSAPTPARTRALETCAYLCIMQGDLSTARSMLAEAKEAAAGEANSANAMRAIQLEALAVLSEGNLASAEPLLVEALRDPRAEQDLLGLLDAYFCLAAVKALQGDLVRAEELCLEAIEKCDLHGETWAKSYMLWCLGFVSLQRGDVAETVRHGREALRLGQSLDEPWAIACCLELLAWAAVATNDAEGAAHLLGAAQRIWGRTGVALLGIRGLTSEHDRCMRMLHETLGDQRLTRTLNQGAAMKLEDAVARGLGRSLDKAVDGPDARISLPSLTKRESEVAGLVAQGLTNKDIAGQLVIAQRTAEAHVERILNKLGFTSRAQVAAWVVEHRGS